MSQPGRFRIPSRNRSYEAHLHPAMRAARRVERILDSLRAEIEGGEVRVRVRQVFERPRAIYRLEIEQPAWGYQRTTLLDRDALEELLAQDGVRDRIEHASLIEGDLDDLRRAVEPLEDPVPRIDVLEDPHR